MTRNNKRTLILPGLMAVMTLTACQANSSTTGATSSQSNQALVVNQTSNTSYFSDRDLDASYDAATASTIKLNGSSATVAGNGVSVAGSVVKISQAGTYVISGKSEGVQILVEAADSDKVQLVLNGVTMTGTDALIAVTSADKVFVTLAEGSQNHLADSANRTATDFSAAIYSKKDLTLNGTGSLTVQGNYNNAIKSNDDLKITGGTYTVTAAKHALSANDALNITGSTLNLTATEDAIHSDNDEDTTMGNLYLADSTVTIKAGDDAIHASNNLVIDSGDITIETSTEGIEGKVVTINGGTITVNATDDGINATDWTKSSDSMTAMEGVNLTINGGDLTINMAQGDTDAIDSNGDVAVTGGNITISGPSAIDFDGTATYTGGTIIHNGQTMTDIVANGPGGGGMPRR
ncbi:carbohydrate-binding domain-containing protein [Streptococcus cuniculipharyngis]|uniref:Carbohydrate-binding domain-containing protein n=1 Tax=Streptococcus cuniculipharyngis TaxID=1562651 RepID=A0A5C5SAT7_9STRE|nr:carbohydrate-binding domain-containing protein [Streptococcus cuniculipharyngis]TWS97677.1 carbohydrate-binding domain-containing protein [Streptococcus cuniculipharyngis]